MIMAFTQKKDEKSMTGFGMRMSAFVSRKCGNDAHLCKCSLACDALVESHAPQHASTMDFLEKCKLKHVTQKNGHEKMATRVTCCFSSMTMMQ